VPFRQSAGRIELGKGQEGGRGTRTKEARMKEAILFFFFLALKLERWDANVLPRPRKGKRFHVSSIDYGLLCYDYDLVERFHVSTVDYGLLSYDIIFFPRYKA
jgi:hypothetical protein